MSGITQVYLHYNLGDACRGKGSSIVKSMDFCDEGMLEDDERLPLPKKFNDLHSHYSGISIRGTKQAGYLYKLQVKHEECEQWVVRGAAILPD